MQGLAWGIRMGGSGNLAQTWSDCSSGAQRQRVDRSAGTVVVVQRLAIMSEVHSRLIQASPTNQVVGKLLLINIVI